jgi:hypothetical protein
MDRSDLLRAIEQVEEVLKSDGCTVDVEVNVEGASFGLAWRTSSFAKPQITVLRSFDARPAAYDAGALLLMVKSLPALIRLARRSRIKSDEIKEALDAVRKECLVAGVPVDPCARAKRD